jgi:hypothetical protein
MIVPKKKAIGESESPLFAMLEKVSANVRKWFYINQ